MCQHQDQGRNQKTPWNKWKWEHNNPKSVGHRESDPIREIIALQAYLKKEKSQINSLTLHLK